MLKRSLLFLIICSAMLICYEWSMGQLIETRPVNMGEGLDLNMPPIVYIENEEISCSSFALHPRLLVTALHCILSPSNKSPGASSLHPIKAVFDGRPWRRPSGTASAMHYYFFNKQGAFTSVQADTESLDVASEEFSDVNTTYLYETHPDIALIELDQSLPLPQIRALLQDREIEKLLRMDVRVERRLVGVSGCKIHISERSSWMNFSKEAYSLPESFEACVQQGTLCACPGMSGGALIARSHGQKYWNPIAVHAAAGSKDGFANIVVIPLTGKIRKALIDPTLRAVRLAYPEDEPAGEVSNFSGWISWSISTYFNTGDFLESTYEPLIRSGLVLIMMYIGGHKIQGEYRLRLPLIAVAGGYILWERGVN